MSAKDTYRYRILKTYSLFVDFDGEPKRKNVPAPIDADETFKQWTQRVLGPTISNVAVFSPRQPGPNTKIKTLQSAAPRRPPQTPPPVAGSNSSTW